VAKWLGNPESKSKDLYHIVTRGNNRQLIFGAGDGSDGELVNLGTGLFVMGKTDSHLARYSSDCFW